jgi:hypothetical protein
MFTIDRFLFDENATMLFQNDPLPRGQEMGEMAMKLMGRGGVCRMAESISWIK